MDTADLVCLSRLQRKVSVDSFPRFKAFCRVVDALRVIEPPAPMLAVYRRVVDATSLENLWQQDLKMSH
jgi:hypothetical protein